MHRRGSPEASGRWGNHARRSGNRDALLGGMMVKHQVAQTRIQRYSG
jgi:hypothetical protein